MKNIYGFTNENANSFKSLYNFSNAKVLFVLGSWGQYFASRLHGADKVDVYDINGMAWDFFVLKYYGIMIFSYENFYDYFVTKKLDDEKHFKYLLSYLPTDVGNRLGSLYERYTGLKC